MTDATRDRLFAVQQAFEHPVTLWSAVGIAVTVVGFGIVIQVLRRVGATSTSTHAELMSRWKSWLWLVAIILFPVLLGAAWTIVGIAVLSLLCYREYARATGIAQQTTINAVVVIGIVLLAFAAIDHWERLFFALAPLTVIVIATASIHNDQPQGYVQRVALGTFGFLLFGFSLAYVSMMSNATDYRPLLIMILIGVEMNDIFAYCVGKTIGKRKLLPNTSPGKTVAGAVGALLLTTALVACIGHFVFANSAMDNPLILITLGFIVGGIGQLGDLMLSSIKRDVGIKDSGSAIPGHGGILDRFDSLVLVPPVVYHYVSLKLGEGKWLGSEETTRIFSSSWF
ncbi:MAG: phosphatidate cytidylyltransferase [Planctomycetes bacterium]|nr:phosphatidate cytidylyltransferase [Planctomycetota bacterium]